MKPTNSLYPAICQFAISKNSGTQLLVFKWKPHRRRCIGKLLANHPNVSCGVRNVDKESSMKRLCIRLSTGNFHQVPFFWLILCTASCGEATGIEAADGRTQTAKKAVLVSNYLSMIRIVSMITFFLFYIYSN